MHELGCDKVPPQRPPTFQIALSSGRWATQPADAILSPSRSALHLQSEIQCLESQCPLL